VFFVIVSIVGCASKKPSKHGDQVETFGQFAQQSSKGKWSSMMALLPDLNEHSTPRGGLGPLRDSLIMIRDVMDIFPFCYPTPTANNADVYKLLRADLNYAYTGIGDYHDLHRVNYSVAVQQQMLNDLLEWKSSFENRTVQYNYENYFSNPDTTTFYYHNETELSIMFWGNSSVVPNIAKSGLYNLALLETAQIQHHLERFFVLTGFPNLTTIYNANYMHDYKKQLRAMKRVGLDWFPQVMNSSAPLFKVLVDQVNACHTMLSKTHDFVIPYLYYAQHGPAQILALSEIQLDEAFYSILKAWLFGNAWVDYLRLFQSLVIVPDQ